MENSNLLSMQRNHPHRIILSSFREDRETITTCDSQVFTLENPVAVHFSLDFLSVFQRNAFRNDQSEGNPKDKMTVQIVRRTWTEIL